ncbi:L,D-transpeptidase family protein [Rhizobium sp.]
MKLLKNATIAALTLSCAMTFGVPTAQSATLLDFLQGKKSTQERKPARNSVFGGSLDDDDVGDFPEAAKPAKALPKVAPPKYFTYKADALKLIAAAKFAPAMQTASADPVTDPGQTGSIQTVSADPQSIQDERAFIGDVKVRAPAEVAAAIEKFYSSNTGLMWVNADGLKDGARVAMAYLEGVDMVGLDPDDYKVVDPTDGLASADPAARQRALMQFEIELSAKILTYVQDTVRGRVDPNRIAEYYDFKRKTVNLDGAMTVMRASPDIAAYLESRTPVNTQFAALQREYVRLKAAAGSTDERIVIAPGTLLKPGNSSAEVANVIAAIQKQGSDKLKVEYSLAFASYQGTAEYTDDLVDVVKAFQAEKGLKADGVVGPGTIRVLMGGDDNSTKMQKIKVAMEQLRWLPKDLGPRYVFINQPAYQVYYHNNNKEEFSMRVVIGSPRNQTFFFQHEISLVEYNPYWGVPRSIIVNEMLPELRADPSYLDRLGYETSIGGRQVSSSSIDWNSTDAVDVRQPPGRGNALGQLKIMFPNAHAIYMHDTPQKEFFKRDMRALSHGCVRLADPKKMAAAVMNMTVPEIEAEIAGGKNKQVKVPEKFPVYIAYFTAYPNKDGVVEYFDDVYSRDSYMEKAFTATAKARDVAS